MTPHELAEKLHSMAHNIQVDKCKCESLLTEALQKESAGMQTTMTNIMNRRIDKAKAEAYENCAKIVERIGENEEEIIKAIRQAARELK